MRENNALGIFDFDDFAMEMTSTELLLVNGGACGGGFSGGSCGGGYTGSGFSYTSSGCGGGGMLSQFTELRLIVEGELVLLEKKQHTKMHIQELILVL